MLLSVLKYANQFTIGHKECKLTESHNIETGFVPINGTELYYTLSGQDHEETMVMLHAGICDHRMWDKQVAHFSQRFQVLTTDMRGFGKSSIPDAPFALHEDIAALIEHFNIDNAWILAASQGGKMAINISLTKPNLVKGLLLVGPAFGGYQYDGDDHPLEEQIDEYYDNGDMEQVSELEVQMWVDGTGRSAADVDPEVRQLVYEMNLIPLQVDEDIWDKEQQLAPPASERLSEISVPTLIVIGDLDVESSIERANILSDKLPNAKKVVMNGTAHVPNMEFPDKFNQIVDDFLQDYL